MCFSQNLTCPTEYTNSTESCTITDHEFLYDNDPMDTTLLSEWVGIYQWLFMFNTDYRVIRKIQDLVCSQEWKVAFVTSIFMVGLLVGSYLSGWLSDVAG